MHVHSRSKNISVRRNQCKITTGSFTFIAVYISVWNSPLSNTHIPSNLLQDRLGSSSGPLIIVSSIIYLIYQPMVTIKYQCCYKQHNVAVFLAMFPLADVGIISPTFILLIQSLFSNAKISTV